MMHGSVAFSGRTLIMAGDSTIAADLSALRKFLDERFALSVRVADLWESPSRPPRIPGSKVNQNPCYEWNTTIRFRLCYFSMGRYAGAGGRVGACNEVKAFDAMDAADAVACLYLLGIIRPHDLLIVNFGLHFPHMLHTKFHDTVQRLAKWYIDVQRNDSHPCFMWRESPPQHFPIPGGAYSAELRTKWHCSNSVQCRPISPRNSSLQPFNDVALPILEQAHVPIIRTFDALADMHQDHVGCQHKEAYLDCTHWSPSGDAQGTVVHLLVSELNGRMQTLCAA